MSDFPWLSVMIAVPILGAIVVQALPRRAQPAAPKQVALGFSVLTLVLALVMASGYKSHDGMQFTEQVDWIDQADNYLRLHVVMNHFGRPGRQRDGSRSECDVAHGAERGP